MPGKHAPASSRSFVFSLTRAGAVVAAAIGVVVAIVLLATGGGGETVAGSTTTPTPSPTATATSTPTVEPTATASPSPTPSALPATQVTVEVLNSTKTPGLASRTRDRIREAGYRVTAIGNAPSSETSTIFYAEGRLLEARALARVFPEFTRVEPAPGDQTVMLRLVLGADFPGANPEAPSPSPTASPSPSPTES